MEKYYEKEGSIPNCKHGVRQGKLGTRGKFVYGHVRLESGATDSYARCGDCGYRRGVIHRRFSK